MTSMRRAESAGYSPSEEVESSIDYQREALRLINNISQEDQARALERYKGPKPLGALSGALRLLRLRDQAKWIDEKINDPIARKLAPIYKWLDQAGERSVSKDEELPVQEQLAQAGNFKKSSGWKKALKIGAKVMGGFGVAGAMVMSGGLGPLTALLWSGGLKEGYDGIMQTVEQIGWGNKRTAAELRCQGELSTLIEDLKARVLDTARPITQAEYFNLVRQILSAEQRLIAQQEQNTKGETRGKQIRSIASSLAVIGTGVFAGVPLGDADLDKGAATALDRSLDSAAGQDVAPILDESHRTFWNAMDGGQFAYEHNGISSAVQDTINGSAASGEEIGRVSEAIDTLNNAYNGQFGSFSLETTDIYGQTGHVLGGGLASSDYAEMGAAAAYLLGDSISHVGETTEPETPYRSYRSISVPSGGGSVSPYRSYGTYGRPSSIVIPGGPGVPVEDDGGGVELPETDTTERAESELADEILPPDKIFDHGPIIPKKERDYGTIPETASEDLRTDENMIIDPDKEIDRYLEHQDEKYMETIKDIAKEAGPMSEKCRLSINIPVAGHQEGKVIYQSLLNYTRQSAEKDSFEIVLLVNRPNQNKEGQPVVDDETMSEIMRFKKDHPEINVRVMNVVVPLENARIGYIRKMLTDSTLLRSRERGKTDDDLIIVSNDADNKGVEPKYVESIIDQFDENPQIDALSGQVDWDPESYMRNPLLLIGTRFFQYLEIQSRKNGWYINSPGANFACRAGMYAAVDGYSPDLPLGEDTDFGQKIKNLRKRESAVGFGGIKKSRIYTSSRRAEHAIMNGMAPIEQWEGEFSAFDDEVRKTDWETITSEINLDSPEGVNKFISGLEYIINRTLKHSSRWEGVNSTSPNVVRTMTWLGIKYTPISATEVRIVDASRLIEGIKKQYPAVYERYKKDILGQE